MLNRLALQMLIMSLSLACAQVEDASLSKTDESKQLFESGADRALRVGLAVLEGERPMVNYQSLLDDGDVVEVGAATGNVRLSSQLRKGLLLLGTYRTDTVDEHLVRVQRFAINRDFPPLRLFRREMNAVLPFRLRGNSHVEFARRFEHRGDMSASTRFSILDVPHDVESALKLPSGTVVTIPVRLHVSMDVGGNFVQESFSKSGQILKPLTASMLGSTSASRQGTLFGEGEFTLQFIRLSEDRVRVRLLSASGLEARARLRGSVEQMVRYFFVPSANLDRLRAFRRRLEKAGRFVRAVRGLDERVDELRARLPDAIRATLDSVPIPLSDERRDAIDRAMEQADSALQRAQNSAQSVRVLDEIVGEKAEDALSRLRSFWDDRIAPATTKIQRLSSRVYRLDQLVQLQDELTRQLRLLGDYEFDLSDEDARTAFEHIVSGRAVWRGVGEFARSWHMDDVTFADFTLADTLATEDQAEDAPRVRRMALGSSDIRQRKYSLSARGFGIDVGLEGEFEDNRVEITDDTGVTRTWQTRAWERGYRSQIFGNARSESYASGAFTSMHEADIARGGYWLRWKKTYGDQVQTPVANAFAHVLNDLGPAAVAAGIPTLYQSEHPGKVDAELFVVVNEEAMSVLFDDSLVDDAVLWSVLGDMMDRYQRPSSLPYAHAPIRPLGLEAIEGATEACEALARRLGGRYCYSFRDRIFPALKKAQLEGDGAARIDFFESFYRVPLGGAALSTRVLIRYLAELFAVLEVDNPFTIRFQVRNHTDDSEAASPHITVGEPLHLTLSDMSALEGMSP